MNVDALKQAAIDAYMRSEGFEIQDDGSYEKDQREFVGPDGTGTATYVYGAGNHAVVDSFDLDYAGRWGEVRSRVDDALEDWQEDRLPKPADLNAGMQKAVAAVTALNIGDSTSYAGALGGYLRTVSENAPQLHGLAMDAFNNSFVNQLPATIGNHACLAAIVAEAWSAEKEIWTQARVDRDALVEQATEALDTYARTKDPSPIKLVLTLTGAAISGAGAIASGGVSLPFTLATASITSLAALTDYAATSEVDRTGADYQELMTAFEEGLADIDDAITAQERLISEGLENGWQVFEGNRTLFDLTPRVSDDGDGDWSDETSLFDVADGQGLEIVLPSEGVIDSLSTGLVNLAHGLAAAAPKVTDGAEASAVLGSSARKVGLRYNGVTIMMWIVADNNSSSILDLDWDVREGNALMQAIVHDFREADAESQAGLDHLRLQLAGGSGQDPWA